MQSTERPLAAAGTGAQSTGIAGLRGIAMASSQGPQKRPTKQDRNAQRNELDRYPGVMNWPDEKDSF